jgi:hypothetical protein
MHTPDPVQLGFVSSLAKPTGNITGVTTLSMEMSLKQLELLREAVSTRRGSLLWNRDNPWHSVTQGPSGWQWVAGAAASGSMCVVPPRQCVPSETTERAQRSRSRRPDDVCSSATAGGPHDQTSDAHDGEPTGLCGSRKPDVVLADTTTFTAGRRLWTGSRGAETWRSFIEQPTKLSWSSTSRPRRRSVARSRNRCC